MKTRLTITDLTRMQRQRVCVAGYAEDGRCIRPVLPPPGIPESSLAAAGKPVIFPFAVVEYELLRHHPQPPHTEDWSYAPGSARYERQLDGKQKRELLESTRFPGVAAIFEQTIQHNPGRFVMDGVGPRSVGTIRLRRILQAVYQESPETGRWDYRLMFVDDQGETYRLKIVDLTWAYYLEGLRTSGQDTRQAFRQLTAALRSCEAIYLRIGLARGWAKFPDRCYLQVTGVYTFPDCLQGKTFLDFLPPPNPQAA